VRRAGAARLSALYAAFVCFGVYWGSFASTIPEFRVAFGLSPGVLGLVLGCFPIVGMPLGLVAGRLCSRLDARAVSVAAALAFTGCGLLLATTHAVWAVPLAAMAVGGVSAVYDVAINTQAVRLEQRGRRVIGRLHGSFFAGSFLGGLLQAAVLASGRSWRVGQTIGALGVGVAALALAALPDRAAGGAPAGRTASGGYRAVLADPKLRRMALLVLVGFGLEGGINSWGGVYLHDSLAVGAAATSVVVGCFALLNAAGSVSADLLGARFGSVRVFIGAGAGVAAAVTAAIAVRAPALAVAGLCAASFLLALLAPSAFSEGSRGRGAGVGQAIGMLTAVGYVAFLVGPVGMGGLAAGVGLRGAIASLALLGAGAAVVAVRHGRATRAGSY
jgi:MFS family permease